MTNVSYAAAQAGEHIHNAIHKATPFVAKFARVGYAAKGVIYSVVGLLAAMAAFGMGGETTGSRGAMNTIALQPFGQVMLGIVALGLACYALWQFVRAIEDPENEGSDTKAIAVRAGFFISGVVHAALVIYATHMLIGSGRGGGDDAGARSWSAWLMSFPFGRIMLALIGVGITLYGLLQLYNAYRMKLDKQLVLERLGTSTRRAVVWISRFGQAARGVVFSLIGLFLILAAWHYNPGQARGIGGALQSLQGQTLGPWLLGAVACGLIAYGIYQFIKARYRRIETS